jgi:hypothetical protein
VILNHKQCQLLYSIMIDRSRIGCNRVRLVTTEPLGSERRIELLNNDCARCITCVRGLEAVESDEA